MKIILREVYESDLPIFFQHQNDPVANTMAALPARNGEAYSIHWQNKIFHNMDVQKKTILFESQIAGHILSWKPSERRLIGYWLGQDFWGKGIASLALSKFLEEYKARPLYAHVAKHNSASIRVLEKNSFVIIEEGKIILKDPPQEIEEWVFGLE